MHATQKEDQSSVLNSLNSYAAIYPDEQPDIINWLARSLVSWMDPRDLSKLAITLSSASSNGHS